MRTLRLRAALSALPAPDRTLWTGIWFRTHTNARYAELLPRLERLDALFFTCSSRRIARGLQFRSYRAAPGTAMQRTLLRRLAPAYRGLFCTELRLVRHFPGPVVVDVDDPYFDPPSIALLRRPNVAAVVTLAEWAAERFRALGVTAPIEIVPQGVALDGLSDTGRSEVATRLRRDGDVVVGYHAALIATGEDRVNPLYDVDHLLELWDAIHARVPRARLWLVGEATERARRRCAGRASVVVVGRVSRDRLLSYVANFDVGVYARRKSAGIQAVKIAEYLGAGVPTVAYDYPVTEIVRAEGAGILVVNERELVDAVERLVLDEPLRHALGARAREAGARLDWDVLARRYEAHILDRYLPPA